MKTRLLSPAKTVLAMRSVYLLFWGTVFIAFQYMAIFLRQYHFMTDFIVGITISCGSLTATVSQVLMGNIADHAKTKNKVLIATIIGVIVGILVLIVPTHTGFLTLIPATLFLYFFLTPPSSLIDTIVVENVGKTGVPYGKIRMCASAGAASAAFMVFLVSLRFTMQPSTTFVLAVGCAVAAMVPVSFLPETKGHGHGAKKEKKGANYVVILKNRRMVLLLCFLLTIFIGTQATNLFLGVYYATEAGFNAGLGSYGLFFAICIGFETLVMLFGSRLWQAMNIYHVFTLVGVAAFGRSFIVYAAPNIVVLYLVAVCQALLFAPLWTRLSPYVNSIVPKEARATGQAAWNIMATGIAPMIGAALGGAVADSAGIRNVFGVSSAILFAGAVVFLFLFRRQDAYDKLHPIEPEA